MASSDTLTSVPVHTSTLRILKQFKTGAQNWDQFLLELLEREMDREDVQFATKVLEEYAAGKIAVTPLRSAQRSPRSRRTR